MVNYRKIVFFYVLIIPECANYDQGVHGSVVNSLRTQRICYIRTQSVPRC